MELQKIFNMELLERFLKNKILYNIIIRIITYILLLHLGLLQNVLFQISTICFFVIA